MASDARGLTARRVFIPSAERFPTPDILRGIAVTAMLIAHAAPLLPDVPPAVRFVTGNINDLASPLFALVMGMSAQIVWNRTTPRGRGRTLLRQAIRAGILIALGLWMTTWGTWVAIVLGYLGVLLLVGAPLLLLSTRWLVILTIVVALASSPLNEWARGNLVWVYTDFSGVSRTIASWLTLGTSYRLTNLLPFFLLGALLLRRPLRGRARWVTAGGAAIAYLVKPIAERLLGVESFVSGSYPDTLHDAGLVMLTVVVVSWLSDSRGRVHAVSQTILAPVKAVGVVALSVYLLHVALLAWVAPGGARTTENDYLAWLVIVPVVFVVGATWQRFVGTGPVEWLIRVLTPSAER